MTVDTLRSQLEQRLQALKSEHDSGQKMLADLVTRQTALRETLLRIGGAIQVLEEELSQPNDTLLEGAQHPVNTTMVEPNGRPVNG
jgi:hypothetical protein